MIRNWAATAAGAIRTTPAPVTRTLIVLCCLVFLVGPASGLHPAHGSGDELLAAQRAYFRRWGVIPADLFDGSLAAVLTPATALFVHGSWVHLLGNMLFLHVFGPMTEARMGRVRFTLCYAGCGYLALLGYAAANAGSERSLVGASGAISAVLGAFLFLFPRGRVTSLLPFALFLPVRLPAWVVLPFWAALQWAAAGRTAEGGPGVAHLAHLVGFGLGFGCAWVWRGGATTVRSAPAPAPEGENQP
ncbi:rhomboid family intramembrane serine protease [Streptomyces sp. Vc74B-19]|uniref:rhomboid family intramembrane serine protease n=1 Tax=unclassified Streptomyces TaxID=2593676 RepID=UPI001BFCB0DF|nr:MULTISPECIES: rhomboid family intramembrane serine protease [unclassified Streptomyces]MBT3165942.1 rhomboid family intramembrane serine protease [Streptomyces sp. Vc74B-19]MCO4698953.1 rhomboid family intramembrane serine protease [Streptomyces sp. RO-S4]MDU0304009.1 rhomboid family intramembrane serine protease [Streptomyces sp. PAL114]